MSGFGAFSATNYMRMYLAYNKNIIIDETDNIGSGL